MMDDMKIQCNKLKDTGQIQARGRFSGCSNAELQSCNRFQLLRKRVHQPADAYRDEQKGQKRPNRILGAFHSATLGQERESYGNHQGKKQHCAEMVEVAEQSVHLGSPPLAISYASSTVSKFSMPAAAKSLVP